MKTHEIQKNQELCDRLNMNFDEANDLFATETLQSMQMAQVNGGFVPSWPVVKAIVETVAAVATVVGAAATVKQCSDDKPTPEPTKAEETGKTKDSLFNGVQKIDSVITIYPDGTTQKAYGVTFAPTFAPTPAQ